MQSKEKPDILQVMNQIERDCNVRILFACTIGSHGQGLATPQSGYDIRFVYIRPTLDYLSIEPEETKLLLRDPSKIADIQGWDARTFLYKLLDSNMTALSWLKTSQIDAVGGDSLTLIRHIARDCVAPAKVFTSYRNLARANHVSLFEKRSHTTAKQLLLNLHGALSALYTYELEDTPPMSISTIQEALNINLEQDHRWHGIGLSKMVVELIKELLVEKASGTNLPAKHELCALYSSAMNLIFKVTDPNKKNLRKAFAPRAKALDNANKLFLNRLAATKYSVLN